MNNQLFFVFLKTRMPNVAVCIYEGSHDQCEKVAQFLTKHLPTDKFQYWFEVDDMPF